MNRQETCWSGVLGRGLYPPQLLSRVYLRKMTGELYLSKSVSCFTFRFERGNLTECSKGKPAMGTTPRKAVREVCNWGEGTYSFVTQFVAKDGPPADSHPTAKLILDGVRTIRNLFLVQEALGRDQGLIQPVDKPPGGTAFQLSPVESFLLSRIDRPCTVEELCLVSPVTRSETLIGILALLCAGVVEGEGDPLLREPVGMHGMNDGELLGAVRSFSGLGPARPPSQVHPSFTRSRQRAVPDTVIIGLPSNNNWREGGSAMHCETIAEADVPEDLEPDTQADPLDMARYHFEKGLEHFANEDFYSAVQLFKLAVKIDDQKAEYHRHLALALSRNPKWGRKAEQSLIRAVELEPDHAETHYFLGRIYLDSGLPARAMARFRESLRIDPDLKPARLELAVMNGAARDVDREPVSPALLGRNSRDQGV